MTATNFPPVADFMDQLLPPGSHLHTHPQLAQSLMADLLDDPTRRFAASLCATGEPIQVPKAQVIAEMITSECTENRGNLLIEVSEHLRKMGQGFTGACLWHAGQRYNAG